MSVRPERLAEHHGLAGRRSLPAESEAEQGGLARAVGADDDPPLAGATVQSIVVQDGRAVDPARRRHVGLAPIGHPSFVASHVHPDGTNRSSTPPSASSPSSCSSLPTAFFVAVEFALVAVDRSRVSRHAAEGRRRPGPPRSCSSGCRSTSPAPSSASPSPRWCSASSPSRRRGRAARAARRRRRRRATGPTAVSVVVALVLATLVQMVVGELVPEVAGHRQAPRRRLRPGRADAWSTAASLGPLISCLQRGRQLDRPPPRHRAAGGAALGAVASRSSSC